MIKASTPWCAAGDAALQSGPLDRVTLAREIARVVPPSVAILIVERHQRSYEARARANGVPNGRWQGGGSQPRDPIMSGSQVKAVEVIRNRVKCGRWVELHDGRIATREWVAENMSTASESVGGVA